MFGFPPFDAFSTLAFSIWYSRYCNAHFWTSYLTIECEGIHDDHSIASLLVYLHNEFVVHLIASSR